jgi:hypothetical protein
VSISKRTVLARYSAIRFLFGAVLVGGLLALLLYVALEGDRSSATGLCVLLSIVLLLSPWHFAAFVGALFGRSEAIWLEGGRLFWGPFCSSLPVEGIVEARRTQRSRSDVGDNIEFVTSNGQVKTVRTLFFQNRASVVDAICSGEFRRAAA